MNNFDQEMRRYQAEWRRDNIKIQEWGYHNGKQHPFILPSNEWTEGLWSGIRPGAKNDLLAYLEENDIDHHTGVHNLRSSWVLCANVYFPFREDLKLIARFLNGRVNSSIASIEQIELEYAELAPLDAKTLLGEPAGTRGKNQTSPDIAFIFKTVDGNKGIILTENKFVEHSFYPCSGRKHKYGNPDTKRCLDFHAVMTDLPGECYQLSWAEEGRTNRNYWDYIRITDDGRMHLKYCPAAVAGYQLFRQQALAEAFIQNGDYTAAISCVAYDARNKTLLGCLKSTGIHDFSDGWGKIFDGKAEFASFTHQEWVSWVAQNDITGRWQDWLAYVKKRYGF